MEVPVRLQGEFTPWLQKVMTDTVDVLGFPVTYVTASPTSTSYITVDQDALVQTANPHLILAAHIRAMVDPVVNPFPNADPSKVMYLDIETHNEGKQWGMKPSEFFRLGQWAWGIDGEIHVTTDYHEFMAQVAQAEGLIAHNGHNFDFSVLFGADSVTPLRMAQKGMLLDTMVWANLAFPAPPRYMARSGAFFRVTKPGEYMRWLSLDNLAFQLDVPGKLGDLKTLAKKHNPPKTLVGDLDFGLIPLDDPEFLAYAEADVKVLQDVVRKLTLMHPLNAYDWREQLTSAVMAQITRNGWTVDLPAVHRRRDSLLERRAEIMDMLVRDFDFPTEGKAPWASAAGKEAIERIVLHYNPDAHDGWPKTPKGALKMGGDELRALLEGTEGEEVGTALAELKGQRSLSQLTIDSVKADGKVHPDISPLQRSGRFSVTNPGLTVWTARGENAVEKAYFVPSNGSKLVSFDLSNADARAVAAYSGDKAYRKNFLTGVDNHLNVAFMVYGEQDDFEDNKPFYRNLAKALSHAWNYGGGAKTISRASGRSLEEAEFFVKRMNQMFPGVVKWRNRMAELGERQGFIKNKWGRKMPVERDHAYTQSSALMGQSGTREIMVDAVLKMLDRDIRLVQWIKAIVHDEFVFDIPESELAWAVPTIRDLMYYEWDGVEFHADNGEPADNWERAGH